MSSLRAHYIDTGAIRPRADRQRPALRLDAAGERAAARHIAAYLADPRAFVSRPFIPNWNPPR